MSDYTPRDFLFAGKNGDYENVKKILSNGIFEVDVCDKNYQDNKTCLMLAAENGKINVVKYLLDNKANCNLFDQHGYTALMLAALKDYSDILALLIKHGANKSLKNAEGNTALEIAKIRSEVTGKRFKSIGVIEGEVDASSEVTSLESSSPEVSNSNANYVASPSRIPAEESAQENSPVVTSSPTSTTRAAQINRYKAKAKENRVASVDSEISELSPTKVSDDSANAPSVTTNSPVNSISANAARLRQQAKEKKEREKAAISSYNDPDDDVPPLIDLSKEENNMYAEVASPHVPSAVKTVETKTNSAKITSTSGPSSSSSNSNKDTSSSIIDNNANNSDATNVKSNAPISSISANAARLRQDAKEKKEREKAALLSQVDAADNDVKKSSSSFLPLSIIVAVLALLVGIWFWYYKI